MAFSPLPLKNSGLQVISVSTSLTLSVRVRHWAAVICRSGAVAVGRLDQVEIQVGAGRVNVRVAGVGLFGAFVVALNAADFRALVFCESHNCVLVAHGFLLYVSILVDNPRSGGNWWYHICDFCGMGFISAVRTVRCTECCTPYSTYSSFESHYEKFSEWNSTFTPLKPRTRLLLGR